MMLAAQSFYRLSGFVIVMVLARSLPAATIGAFVFAVAFAESFLAIANFGLNSVMSRKVAADPASASSHFSVIVGFRLVSGVIYVAIVTLAAVMFTSAPWKLMLAATLIVLAEDTYYSFGSLFLALRKAVYNVTLGVTVQALFIVMLLIGMYLRPSLWLLVAVNAFRAFVLLIGAAWLTHRRLFGLSMSWDSVAIRTALPFLGMAVVNALRDQIGAVMLGLLSSYDAVAYYNLVSRVQTASLAIPTAVAAVLTPLIVAHGLDDRNRKRLMTATLLLLAAALTGSAIVRIFPERIASILYGPLAPQTSPLVPVLGLIFPISFLALFSSLVLQALYRELHVLRTMIVVAVSNVLLNLLLIPQSGAKGALYALLIATTIQLVILSWDLRAKLSDRTLRQ